MVGKKLAAAVNFHITEEPTTVTWSSNASYPEHHRKITGAQEQGNTLTTHRNSPEHPRAHCVAQAGLELVVLLLHILT